MQAPAWVTAADPLPARLRAWLAERFPVGPIGLMVLVLHGACWQAGRALAGGAGRTGVLGWLAGWIVLLGVFLHLRIFDEHKDFEADRAAFPDRLLSRGVVTLADLRRLGAVVLLVEAACAAWLGPQPLLAWAAVLAFTLAMLVEFGVGRWLRNHLVIYAITHNPVLALVAVFSIVSAGVPLVPAHLAVALFVSAVGLVYEIGRKIRLPDEEIPGAPTYSAALGRGRALGLLAGVAALSVGLLYVVLALLPGLPRWAWAMPAIPVVVALGVLGRPSRAPAGRVEVASSLGMVLLLAVLLLAASMASAGEVP